VAKHDDLDSEVRVPATGKSDELEEAAEGPVEERESHRRMLAAQGAKRQSAAHGGWMTFSAPTSPTRFWRSSSGPVSMTARIWFRACVLALMAVRLAMRSSRIASTGPSALLGIAVASPAWTARTAESASAGSDFPWRRRCRLGGFNRRLNDRLPNHKTRCMSAWYYVAHGSW
jgi:hypothetical protein